MSSFTKHIFKLLCALSFFTAEIATAAPPPDECPEPATQISDPSPPDLGTSPSIGIAANGTAIGVWLDFEQSSNEYTLQSSVFPEGETWSGIIVISDFVESPGTIFFSQVAVAPSGNAVAAWNEYDGKNYIIMANMYRADTDEWTGPVQISAAVGVPVSPQVAINTISSTTDHGVVIWAEGTPGTTSLVSRTIDIVNFIGDWATFPVEVVPGNTDSLFETQVAVDPSGTAYAVWTNVTIMPTVIQAATLPVTVGASWSSPSIISDKTLESSAPNVDTGSSGFAVAAWDSQIPLGRTSTIYASVFQGGNWGPFTIISSPSFTSQSNSVAADSNNNAIVIWDEELVSGGMEHIESAFRPAGGPWGTPIQASLDVLDAETPNVGLDDAGNAYAIWTSPIVNFATLAFGSDAWSSPTCNNFSNPAASSDFSFIAVDPNGYAVLIWQNLLSSGSETIQSTFFPPPSSTLVITSITPTSGSTSGENIVVITGSGFLSVTNVLFGGVPALNFTIISDTLILATVPPSGTPGAVDVIVSSSTIDSNAVTYTYLTPVCWQR